MGSGNQPDACLRVGGSWVETPPRNVPPPQCEALHLNGTDGRHELNVPEWLLQPGLWVNTTTSSVVCTLRVRYNVSLGDTWDVDWKYNDLASSPVQKSLLRSWPVRDWLGLGWTPLKLNLDTAKYGRTFQDRSHVFRVSPRPTGITGKIYNVNALGRKGTPQQVTLLKTNHIFLEK